jgi:23S rRNA (adenine2503-C2)-methyltransferase
MRPSFYSLSYSDLVAVCEQNVLPRQGPGQLFNWYYKKKAQHPCLLHNLSLKSKAFFNENFNFDLPKIERTVESKDKTVKFLLNLEDGKSIECVLIPFQGKYTACLSSQVGCLMNCSFCYTGEQGFTRNLQTEEIIGQFLIIQKWLTKNRMGDDKILNVVFMGQGEPLHNFEAVKKACEIFISQHGFSLAVHKITISTAGYLPGLKRWKAEMPNVNIALSLHAISPEKRNRLIPLNRKYPLDEILPVINEIPVDEKRFVTYEYLVLDNYNDSDEEIHKVGEALRGKKAYINLIPFNPFPGSQFNRPSDAKIRRIKTILDSYQIPTTIRTTKGGEVLAACGQLNSQKTGDTQESSYF